jgi:uncharacterized protein YegJ (DUF2314 family)
MKRLGTLFLSAFVLVGCERSPEETVTERANADHVQMVKAEDPAMLRAFDKARASLDSFLQVLASGDPRIRTPSVKVRIEDHGAVEYFWISKLSMTTGGFSGTIDNDAELVHNVKLGQTINFPRSQIYDWTYFDATTGRTMGNFTVCALLSHESPQDAADFKAKYHLDCDI